KFFMILLTLLLLFLLATKLFVTPQTMVEKNVTVLPQKTQEPTAIKEVQPTSSVQNFSQVQTSDETQLIETYNKEVTALLKEAFSAKSNEEFEKSLNIYNQIIELLRGSSDTELLKLYAKAHFGKASLLKYHMGREEEALQTYEAIAQEFKHSDNVELLKLYSQAQIYKSHLLDREKSSEIYDEIIEKFKDSDDVTLLRQFALAQISKSYLTTGYESVEIYDAIINKFKNRDDKELLNELYQAQLNKAYILEESIKNKEEAIEVYEQIIEQFSTYDTPEFQERVDAALFAKSFLLMDGDGEESMEIFDTLIDKYKNSDLNNIPQNLEYSIVNNIELALITNNDDAEYQELARTYLENSNEAKPQIEMLEILKNAQELDQDEALANWKEEYKDFSFQNWSFSELERWNNEMEEGESKERIKKYLDSFATQNSPVIYQDPYQHHQSTK
nr:tetratricopeptide repeat protein [Campylobacterota bacterium]